MWVHIVLLAAVALFPRGSTAQKDPPSTWNSTVGPRSGKASEAKWNYTWQMNLSTILYTCNFSGYIEPEALKGWGMLQFDWSNGLEVWSKAKPMNADENAMTQINMMLEANPKQKHSIYRNTGYCFPMYSECRKLLDDPAYAPWFIKFRPEPFKPSVPRCSNLSGKELCSDYYRFEDFAWGRGIPNYPGNDSYSGYGRCTAPGCDCGTKPCGFYVWNFSSDAVVHGQTFTEWFADTYVLGENGGSPLVHGYYFDDGWGGVWDPNYQNSGYGKCTMGDSNGWQEAIFADDTGFTEEDCTAQRKAYEHTLTVTTDKLLAAGKFSQGGSTGWAGLLNLGAVPAKSTKQCIKDLHDFCRPNSSAQTDVTAFSFTYKWGSSAGEVPFQLEWDITNFLLIRGPYNWFGYPYTGFPYGWCFGVPGDTPRYPVVSEVFYYPAEQFDKDYGEPIDGQVCRETSEGSGVFRREWTKSTIEVDCNTLTPTITMK